MTATRQIRLVARREIHERLRARSFKVVTAVLLAVTCGSIVVPELVGRERSYRVVAASRVQDAVRQSLRSHVAGDRFEISTVDRASEREVAVRSGRADIAVDGDGLVLVKRAPDPTRPSSLAVLAAGVARDLAFAELFREAGIGPAQARSFLEPGTERIQALEPPDARRSERHATTMMAAFVLFSLLVMYGSWVLYGVVEERTTRVVEVLLATIRPTVFLAGKIIGIGVVALGQAALLGGATLATSAAMGDALPEFGPVKLLTTLAWFLGGYVVYATLYAAAGTLAARQEEAGNVAGPISVLLILSYGAATAVGADPPTGILVLASIVPPFSALVMPVRMAAHPVPTWELALAIFLLVACAAIVIRLAGRIYARGALRGAARVRYRDALRELRAAA